MDPDTFIVHRSHKSNNLKVLERKLGDKQRLISMTNGIVGDFNVDDDLRKEFCLNDVNLLELCLIGIFLEKNYESPRDIEWAIVDVRRLFRNIF